MDYDYINTLQQYIREGRFEEARLLLDMELLPQAVALLTLLRPRLTLARLMGRKSEVEQLESTIQVFEGFCRLMAQG